MFADTFVILLTWITLYRREGLLRRYTFQYILVRDGKQPLPHSLKVHRNRFLRVQGLFISCKSYYKRKHISISSRSAL